MAKTIEIENVPDEVHEALRTRAAEAGLPVNDYLLQELRAAALRPSIDELERLLKHRIPIDLGPDGAARLVREGREERTDQILKAVGRSCGPAARIHYIE